MDLDGRPSGAAALPPWTCRLSAVVRLGLRSGRPTALAVVAYAQTPVGPYGEALLAELCLPRGLPLRVTVPWIVVDSAASAAAGRANWALPKAVAELDLAVSLDVDRQGAVVAGQDGVDLRLRARAAGPRVPVALAAVLAQPGRGLAPLHFRGRARPALVRVTGGPSSGRGPGAVLEGVLHLAGPSS